MLKIKDSKILLAVHESIKDIENHPEYEATYAATQNIKINNKKYQIQIAVTSIEYDLMQVLTEKQLVNKES